MLDAGQRVVLVDVREPGSGLPAISTVRSWFHCRPSSPVRGSAGSPDRIPVLYCKTGARSAAALAVLRGAGSPTRCTCEAESLPGPNAIRSRHGRPLTPSLPRYALPWPCDRRTTAGARDGGLRSERRSARAPGRGAGRAAGAAVRSCCRSSPTMPAPPGRPRSARRCSSTGCGWPGRCAPPTAATWSRLARGHLRLRRARAPPRRG